MNSISVIIPTYNRADMVCQCVQSVLATNYPELEIIVVDDCSPSHINEVIAREFAGNPKVRSIRNAQNLMTTASRNHGATVAKGDFLFFLDDDNKIDPNCIKEMLATFERHPEAGLVGALSIQHATGEKRLVWTIGADFHRWSSRPNDDVAGLIPIAEVPVEPLDRTTTYAPNAFMVTREAFDSVNGFDESLGMMYDESDFGWRVLETGKKAFLSRNAITNHYGYVEPNQATPLRRLGIEQPLRTFCFARNRLRFARRHFSFLQALSVTLIFAPLSAAYYTLVALKNHRPDIAWAYIRGTLTGLFLK